jgi:hypothetical protein
MPRKGQPRYDTCWRKSRIAARILLREEAGKLTSRDVALGRKLAHDEGVMPRLIDQALHGIRGKKNRLERENLNAKTQRCKGATMILQLQVQATNQQVFVRAPISLPVFATLRLRAFALNPNYVVTARAF